MSDSRIPYCGECCFLQDEDVNGIGYCRLRRGPMGCDDQCELDHYGIDNNEAAYGLHYFQKWRRGAKIAMPHPYVVGKLIDASIRNFRKKIIWLKN